MGMCNVYTSETHMHHTYTHTHTHTLVHTHTHIWTSILPSILPSSSQHTLNVCYFFDDQTGTWLPMPLSWERHIPDIQARITEIQVRAGDWCQGAVAICMGTRHVLQGLGTRHVITMSTPTYFPSLLHHYLPSINKYYIITFPSINKYYIITFPSINKHYIITFPSINKYYIITFLHHYRPVTLSPFRIPSLIGRTRRPSWVY